MQRRLISRFGLGALTLAVGYAAFNVGGIEWRHSNVSLLIIGVVALILPITCLHSQRLTKLEQIAIWASLGFPLYVAVQLVPVPLSILHLFSPTRAETLEVFAKIVQPVSYASLTLSQSETRAFLPKIAGYVLVSASRNRNCKSIPQIRLSSRRGFLLRANSKDQT
jgi:hypothetical protein